MRSNKDKELLITQEILKSSLSYNKDAGLFTWRYAKKGTAKGSFAGCVNSLGYTFIGINKNRYLGHRLAWLYIHGKWPDNCIDHINGNRSDNRIDNLRDVTHLENHKNRRMNTNNTSGSTGITWRKDLCRWCARIYVNGKQIYLGFFENKLDAINARKKADNKYNIFTTKQIS